MKFKCNIHKIEKVWRRMLGERFLNVDPKDTRLLATEAPFGPLVLQEAANEVRVSRLPKFGKPDGVYPLACRRR